MGGVVVLAGLSSLYLTMLRSKRKQEQNGTNPLCALLLCLFVSCSSHHIMQMNKSLLVLMRNVIHRVTCPRRLPQRLNRGDQMRPALTKKRYLKQC